MDEKWLSWSLLALLSWGCWGLFPKLATNYITPRSAIMWECLGAAVAALVAVGLLGGRPEVNAKGIAFGMLTGVFALAGAWFYVNAAARGRISVIVTITALYPVVTVLLAWIVLREPIGFRQVLATLLAVTALLLLAA